MENKNNWNELFKNISSSIIVIYGKDGKEVLRMDAILWLLLCILIWVVGLVFIVMILTNNWYFLTEKKA